jgi:poly-beta-1,6-N-acetyl-D-glucosamine synthase
MHRNSSERKLLAMAEYSPIGNYVVISPVRDEGLYVERTIQSVIGQSLRPRMWIVVDDGSRDATPEILTRYAEQCTWIKSLSLARAGERKPGSAVIRAFMAGYELIKNDQFDFVVKLDCDLQIPEEYFETLIGRFQADPELGIASGIYMEESRQTWRPVNMPKYHAAGCSKMVRAQCFREIGGFITNRGWDTVDEIRAQAMGWKTCHFEDIALRHLKTEGTGIGSRRTNLMLGQIYYLTGGGTPFFLLKCVHRLIFGRPIFLGGITMFLGFLQAYLKGEPRLVTEVEAVRYRRLLNERVVGAWAEVLNWLRPNRKTMGCS